MIRYLNGEEKAVCRALWEEAFPEDSRSFDDYYFAEILKENQILIREEEGRLVSMLHRNPYRVHMKSRSFMIDYIVGVATAADCRHRGYMRSLLERMMEDMYREHMPFCFLMPADERIYLPFGFRYIFDQPRFAWKEGLCVEKRLLDGIDADRVGEAADWINRWLESRYQVYAERSAAYMERLLKEIQSENGSVHAVYRNKQLIGYESRWGWKKQEQRFCYGVDDAVDMLETKPAIMGRIIHLPEFLKEICLKKGKAAVVLLELQDDMIPQNDGRWLWHINHESSQAKRCSDEQWKQTLEKGVAPLRLSVEDLTQWLFGYRMPEGAGEYAEQIQTIQGVFLDEVV